MRRTLSVSLVCLVTLGGCAVGPAYVRPTTAIPAAYKEAEGWVRAAPVDAMDRGDWWSLFQDPLLDRLERQVEVSNQNLAAAEAAYRQARGLVREQRAAFFPTVSLDGQAGAQKSAGSTGVASRVAGYTYDIGATWEPDVWGAIRRTVESGQASAQASAADVASARLSAQGELAVDYLQLRESDAEMALVQSTVEDYARALRITQNRYALGIAAKSDVLQAQTQLANAQANLASLVLQRAELEHAIAVLVGQAPGSFALAVAPSWTQTVPNIPPGIPSTLLQRRPDIAGAERRVAAANAKIGVAEAAFFPTFSLTASGGGEGAKLTQLFSASGSLWSLGLSLAETIFDGGARHAQVDQAKAARDEAAAQYRQTTLAAFQDVEDQLAGTRVLAERAERLAEASKAADEAEQISLNQYKAGLIAYTTVVVTQTAAQSARQALAQAVRDRQTTAVALVQALGGGFQAS